MIRTLRGRLPIGRSVLGSESLPGQKGRLKDSLSGVIIQVDEQE
jgi:hypothetical protein